MDHYLTVFASSSDAIAPEFFALAKALGQQIAKYGYHLLYGGTNLGLMGAVARAVKETGGKVIGVIPSRIADQCPPLVGVDELITTEKMSERKAILEERSNGFIALPGGFGTLEEILEVITLKQLDYHRKPIVFINVNGFFNDLFCQFEKSYSENFAKENYRKLYATVNTSEEAMNYIIDYRYEDMGPKWFNVPSK